MTSFIGKNSISNLSKILKEENTKNLLVFTGKKSFDAIKPIIEKELADCNITYYNNFSTNPKKEEIDVAIKELGNNFDIIIAIGGGSVIDFAKAYKYYLKATSKFIAIPTTFGTGSEATQFAVIYIDGVKQSLDDKSILPDYAIVDARFAQDNPKYLKACTALDAYCQAIESYWSVKSTEESRQFAKRAIELCKANIVDYVNTYNSDTLEKMAEASHLAGKAINISRTTAAHALSYKITTDYGLPHGHAVAMSIARLAKLNYEIDANCCIDNRGVEFVFAKMLELKEILTEDPISYFEDLFKNIGIEFPSIDVDEVVASVNLQRLANNPRRLSSTDCKWILKY